MGGRFDENWLTRKIIVLALQISSSIAAVCVVKLKRFQKLYDNENKCSA